MSQFLFFFAFPTSRFHLTILYSLFCILLYLFRVKAKSIKGKSAEEIISALEGSLADGFNPTLALAFISIQLDRDAIRQHFRKTGIDLIGASSTGEFINGHEDSHSAVILLMDINRDFYTILFEDVTNKDLRECVSRLAQKAKNKFAQPGFILCTTSMSFRGEFLDGEVIVRQIEKEIGEQVNISGGMAGDDATFTGTYVFTTDHLSDEGIAALVLDETKISLYGMAISGWQPLGLTRTVTQSDGRKVYKIDDQPAVDMYMKYLGHDPKSGEDKYSLFEAVGAHYPFQVEREVGEPGMVTPIGIDKEENALICEAKIPQGAKIRFSAPPDFDIVDKVVAKAKQLKENENADADALLIFSCIGRFSAMGPLAHQENEGLSEIWKAPMAGFYTYGEFGRAVNGRQEYHSTTCSWVALKEKDKE